MQVEVESKEFYRRDDSPGKTVVVSEEVSDRSIDVREGKNAVIEIIEVSSTGDGSRGGKKRGYQRKASVSLTPQEIVLLVKKAAAAGLISIKAEISVAER